MPVYRAGGLYVVEQAPRKNAILRQLKQIDERLFLEKQISFDNKPVWCVVCVVGGDQPPLTLIEYRDDAGEPIAEPTEHLVWRVAQMERDGNKLAKRVLEANNALLEGRKRQAREEMQEVSRDVLRSSTRLPLFHRGVHLRGRTP